MFIINKMLIKTVYENLAEKSKEHLTCDLVKESANQQQISYKNNSERSVSLSQKHGKPLVIELYPKAEGKTISADDLFKLQSTHGLSPNKICEIANLIRISLQD